jgi:hypothetical protein
MADDLFALRVQLEKTSAKLLDDCEHYMREAGLLDLLLERLHLISSVGLADDVVVVVNDAPVRVCELKPFAELLLRECLAIAKRDWSTARKHQEITVVSQIAGFEP